MTLDRETALSDALETAGHEYTKAINEIDSLTDALKGDSDQEWVGQRLQQIARQTRETEAHVTPLREDWKRQGEAPGQRLREVMARQQSILGDLIERINTVESSARAARDRLLPEIDANTRSHEMRSAYARSVRQASE